MYKLNFKKRAWIIKQKIKGASASKLALCQGVSDRTIREVGQKYKRFGWDGLKGHKTGRPEIVLNHNAEIIILDL